jgi:ferredoxin
MKISIDRDRCTGHGRCYALAPDVFAPDDEGNGMAIVEDVPAELADAARRAAANCPERAIALDDVPA